MVKRKFKYEAGAATQFISRRRARKKLQVSLADFRRLCILKGIYPHEPKNKKQVNKGSTAPRTFYFKKDIDFLAHEPLITKFRKHKATIKKLKRATGRKDYKRAENIRDTFDQYTVDHIVLERYPNFIDAIRDLDDALTLIFLFSTFPQSRKVHSEMIALCKRLKTEFLQYVIQTKAIKKCFISIKGIYLQAEIANEKVTWIIPHSHAHEPPSDVDFRVMSTFADFYTVLVGFTVFQLYKKEGLVYPPQVEKSNESEISKSSKELLDSLLYNVVKLPAEEDLSSIDQETQEEMNEENSKDLTEQQKEVMHNDLKLQKLFENKTFYFNRETPKECLILLVRSLGGLISEDVNEPKINYEIADRGKHTDLKYSSQRSYLQPQWIFDSINAGFLLPVNRYLPESELPAHLSPFIAEKEGNYKPPERMEIEAMARGGDPGLIYGGKGSDEDAGESEDDEVDEVAESEGESESENEDHEGDGQSTNTKDSKTSKKSGESPDKQEIKKTSASKDPIILKATVLKGKKDNPKGKFKDQDATEERRLAISAMPKKFKRLHKRIEHGKKVEKQTNEKLSKKRKNFEENNKRNRKSGNKKVKN